MEKQTVLVDHAALKANQLTIIALAMLSFLLNAPLLALATGIVMAAGTALGKPGFLPLYAGLIRPLGLMKAEPIQDNPEPHRFAQGFGAVVLTAGAAAVFLGSPMLGWVLVWLVIFLAALNALAGFCAGCFMYYMLSRLGLPLFSKSPPQDSRPGFKPRQISWTEKR